MTVFSYIKKSCDLIQFDFDNVERYVIIKFILIYLVSSECIFIKIISLV